MAVNTDLIEVIKASQLPKIPNPTAGDFVHAQGDDLSTTPISYFIEKINSGYNDTMSNSISVPATGYYRYKVINPGTYTNVTPNITVTEEELKNNIVVISVRDNVAIKELDFKPVYDDSNIAGRVLTFSVNKNDSNLSKFQDIVKNVYIESSHMISNVEYIGINDTVDRRIYIMLKDSNNKLAAFILDATDLRVLRNNTIELLSKEEDVTFRNETRVFVEFNDVNFPLKSEVSFLIHNPDYTILPPAYDYQHNNTYELTNSGAKEQNVVDLFTKIVDNIYIVDESGKGLSKDNLFLSNVFVNQYSGERKLLLMLSHGSENLIFYTKSNIPSGAKRFELELKEGAANGVRVFIDFKNFGTYPSNEYVIEWVAGKVLFTGYAFTNFNINTDAKIDSIYKEIGSINGIVNVISVDKSKGNNAVQIALNSITDATQSNRYRIELANGVYEIKKKEDFIGNPGYPAMICPKDHVDIKGQSRTSTILSANFDDSPGEDTWMYQTVYNWANDVVISDLTLIAKNLRYVLHQDNPQEANGSRKYENIDFIFIGNGGGLRALGTGTYTGSKTYVEAGSSRSDAFPTFTVHNNINFSKPSLWSFKNHSFETLNHTDVIHVYNSGSNQDCEIILENCSFNGAFVLLYQEYWLYQQNVNDHFNHANWRVRGANNTPFYFKNNVVGSTLCIETLSKTKDSYVLFDTTSSAYNLIIKNPRGNYSGHLGNPNRKIKDGYIIQNGASGLPAYAFGGMSILEQYYFPDGGGSWTPKEDSLGKRLGDCSTVNKNLGIIINGTTYNVVFNKNYTSFTNSQVISEINTVINSVATAKEYNIGADYYAEMADVVSIEVNASTSVIPKGSLVSKVGSKVKICEDGEALYGLAIDDIAPYELDSQGVIINKGRVLKNCYVSLDTGNVSSVLFTGSGDKYKISSGRFVADANGSFNLFSDKYIKI